MNCKDCCQDCQRIGCDIELKCSGYVEPSNGTKERMDKRLAMMHKLYPDAKPTKADYIRSMTDEELAEFIASGVPKDVCKDRCGGDESFQCSECVLDWLRQEYE